MGKDEASAVVAGLADMLWEGQGERTLTDGYEYMAMLSLQWLWLVGRNWPKK